MQISDIHSQALQLLNSDNSDYESAKLMPYTQGAIAKMQDLRIEVNDPNVITQATTTFTNPINIPSDFACTVPKGASYPIIQIDGKIKPTSSSFPQVTFKYAKTIPDVNYVTDVFPLPDYFAWFVAQYIKIQLELDNSMDVSQDVQLLQDRIDSYRKSRGV